MESPTEEFILDYNSCVHRFIERYASNRSILYKRFFAQRKSLLMTQFLFFVWGGGEEVHDNGISHRELPRVNSVQFPLLCKSNGMNMLKCKFERWYAR